jgi:hypothetical protein
MTDQPTPTGQPNPTGQPRPTEDLPVPPGGKPGLPTGSPGKPGTHPARLTLTGTAQPGVEADCLLLQGYLLVGGPRELLRRGGPVKVTGRVQPDLMTTCQQGTPLVVETAEPA